MAKYKGKSVRVNVPASNIAEKFSDLSKLSEFADNIPAEEKARIGEINFESDAIVITNPAAGKMVFRVTECTPEKIVFSADAMVPLGITVDLKPVDDGNETDVSTILDIEIPALLRPMIGGKLQQVADSFGDLIGKMASHSTQV